ISSKSARNKFKLFTKSGGVSFNEASSFTLLKKASSFGKDSSCILFRQYIRDLESQSMLIPLESAENLYKRAQTLKRTFKLEKFSNLITGRLVLTLTVVSTNEELFSELGRASCRERV